MVTVLITSILVLAVISIAIYRWQRVSFDNGRNQSLPPAPDFEGLFADSVAEEQLRLSAVKSDEERDASRRALLARAGEGDKKVLMETHDAGDTEFYDELLNALVDRAENEKQVLALASYISRNDKLPVNVALANALTGIWRISPDRRSTAQMLHIAALTGDAEYYQRSIELVMQFWREQRLLDMTAEELVSIIESEFWLVPSTSRDSGAGFLLKRELARIRRELAAMTRT